MNALVPGSIMLIGDAASDSLRKFCGDWTGAKEKADVSVCFIWLPLEMLLTGYMVVEEFVIEVTLKV